MLEEEVVEAVRAGRFHVWAVHSVDQALALLADREAGAATPDGEFPADTVHGRALARLRRFGMQLAAARSADRS